MNTSAHVLFSLLFGFAGHAQSQVNKCVVNGAVVYQQGACGRDGGTGGELKMVIPSTDSGFAASPELERLRQDNAKAQREFDNALEKHCADKKFEIPAIGMSEADLRCIKRFREPEKINVTTTALGETKQYIYRARSRATYIYFRNGKLDAMQGEQ